MKRYWLLVVGPVLLFTLLLAQRCRQTPPNRLEIVADSIRLTDILAAAARDSSIRHLIAYEAAIATYDNYLDLPEPIKDSMRAAYLRQMVGTDANRTPGHGDSLRTAQTGPSQPQKKP